VRAVEGVRLVEGRNQRSWNIEDEAILKKFSGLKIKSASLISGVSSFVTRIESTNTVSRVVFMPVSASSAYVLQLPLNVPQWIYSDERFRLVKSLTVMYCTAQSITRNEFKCRVSMGCP
jgi:hypothetical protein